MTTSATTSTARGTPHDSGTPDAVGLFTMMARIRAFEATAEKLFLAGQLPGFIHLSIGQEASAAGVISRLRRSDYLTTTHRGHGHTLAKGAPMDGMMAELFGRETGICHGRGGSMHIADFEVGMLGANGIVAGGLGIAVGAALGAVMRGQDHVAAAFFGDGATARGPFAEAINLAQLWHLPVLFVCESNGWASTTRSSEALASTNIAARAAAIGMASAVADGNDVFAVAAAAGPAIERARSGEGPTLLQLDTFRLRGHYVGDPTSYYDKAELAEWTARDPLQRARRAILEEQVTGPDLVTGAELDEVLAAAEAEITAAVEHAKQAPHPDPDRVHDYLYATPDPTDAPAAGGQR